jgi:hypothetical protein
MEKKLKILMIQFCEHFNLKFYELPFSYSLTEEELNASNLYFSGDLQRIINDFNNDYLKIDKRVKSKLKGFSGTGKIEADTVSRIDSIKEKVDNNKDDKVINYLKHNKELFSLLIKVREKISNENIINTIPIPRPEGFVRLIRAKILSKDILGMMVHECIHFILEKNGINYSVQGKDMRDEGLCTFLHKKFGKYFIKDKEYEKWASFFENYFKETPDREIISSLKKIPSDDLMKMMKDLTN